MFGFGGGSSGGTAANTRAKRAQQLRQQRLAANKATVAAPGAAASKASNKKTDEEEEVLIVSGWCTVLCALLIVALGAAMATLFFVLHQPECLQGMPLLGSSSSKADAAATTTTTHSGLRRMKEMGEAPSLQDVEDPAEDTHNNALGIAQQAAGMILANAAEADPVFPPECSAAQMAQLQFQLPAGGCERNKNKAWRRTACSFSMASSCADLVWFKQFYAQNPVSGIFTSIHVGCNKGYQAVELLAVGSQDPYKYDWKEWKTAFVGGAPSQVEDNWESCPHAPVAAGTDKRPARAYCIEPVPNIFERLQQTKAKMNFGDELHMQQLVISNVADDILVHNGGDKIGTEGVGLGNWQQACSNPNGNPDCTQVAVDSLDHWVTTTDIGPTDPIHYVSLGLQGYDYLALVGSARTLKRIHYLELQYHWFGNWGSQSLQDMVVRMKRKHFVCYWAGDNKLWRITDCYQDHYENRFFANIVCVNVQMAPELAKHMEGIFLKTLEQQLMFGEK